MKTGLQAPHARRRGHSNARLILPLLFIALTPAFAATKTWDGGDASSNWASPANWVGNVAPVAGADDLLFAGGVNLTTTNNFAAGSTFNGLAFSNNAGAFVLNGNGLTLGGNVSDAATSNQKINLGLGLGTAGRTFSVSSGGQLEVGAPITGTAGVTKDGPGVLRLTARNTYSGQTVISNGTITLVTSAAPVPGMIYWLDAADLSTIAKDVNNKVSQWNDKSGNSRNFSQSIAVCQPLYVATGAGNKPCVRFDGVTNRLVLGSSSTPQTVFIVNTVATFGNLRGIWGLNQADTGIRMTSGAAWQTPGNGNDFSNPSGSVMYVNGAVTNSFATGVTHLLEVVRSSAASFAATGLGDYFYVSGVAPRPYAGDIAEVIVYDRALSATERQQVEAYLSGKWLGSGGSSVVSSPPVTNSIFWLDAANVSTLVKDANNKVNRWNDAGAGGGPSYASQANTNLQPTFVPYALNGLPVVDFGVYYPDGTGSDTKGQWLGYDVRMNTIRSAFWVGHGCNFIVGDGTSYDFHRGGETATSTIWHSTYVSANIKNGQTYLNGTNVDGTVATLPDAFSMVSVITAGNCNGGRVACDRTFRAGGQQVAELLLYDRALTDQERRDTESYLYNKWFGSGLGSDRLPITTSVTLATSSAVLDLNGINQAIGSLTGVAGSSVTLGLGTLTTGGDNSSTTFAGVISGSGSLVKEGNGTFTLSGANAYTGVTLINHGTLKLAPGASLANSDTIRVASGALLDVSANAGFTLAAGKRLAGSGTVAGLVAIASSGVLSPGTGVGTLTLTSGLTLQSNALLEVEIGVPNDLVRITGGTFTANTNGPAQINVLGTGTLGRYTIMDWNGATTTNVSANAFVLGTTPSGFIGTLQIVSNSLQLVLAPTGPQSIATNTIASLRLAINDLASRYPASYGPLAPGFLARLSTIEANYLAAVGSGNQAGIAAADLAYQLLKREALVLNNPALAFNRVLFVRRTTGLGLPANWQNVSSIGDTACDDRIAVLDITNNAVSEVYAPSTPSFVGYLKPHWNADRLLFTGQFITNGVRSYAVFEMNLDGTGLKMVSPFAGSDVDWFDGCYLPCGDLLMVSTATFAGVPCVTGADAVGNLYRVNPTNGAVRQLTFDQDQNWGPTILADGRVMFTRWEYSDTPHYFSRILFTMMPDGLEQFARYGSGSYFPNTLFDAQPIPGKPSQFVAILSGHHGVAREGEMVLFDETRGMFEADGAVHRFCGPNPVQPVVLDTYVDTRNPWPRFVQPSPLDEKQLLVAARTSSANHWGLYLVDQFDNITTLHYQDGVALLHPVAVRADQVPPVIPDRVKVGTPTGTVNLSDIYFGPGLAGVPHGKVKSLRVYSVHYGYRGQGGHVNTGVDGVWDVHRILGTVPVYEDGSASFTAPANVPISVQPLDEEGKALAVFRSWYTVMPGESVSCAGCHEHRNAGMVNQPTIASRKGPDPITPWNGPARGFSFLREVQPVLDQYCVGCHGGAGGFTNAPPDLANTNRIAPPTTGNTFPISYLNLHRYVRRPGNEGYFRLNNPGEWHADTSELTQILEKGHYGVALDSNAWNRLVTWMDLNVPAWGLWSEHKAIGGSPNYHDRRLQFAISYAGVTNDPEVYPTPGPGRPAFVAPAPPPVITPVTPPPGTIFDVLTARARRNAATNATTPAELTIDLGGGVNLVLDLVPGGAVLMGSAGGYRDETPQTLVTGIPPFYMAKFEIMNKQYALFDPTHPSGFVNIIGKDHCTEGWPCGGTNQPAIRVSWAEAMKFCEWLTKKTGRRFTLPTEAQWEYACRAGTTNDFWWGTAATAWTNQVQLIAGDSFYRAGPLANLAGVEYFEDHDPRQTYWGSTPPWFMCDTNITDPWVAPADVDTFASNPFGLCGLHGNAAEWTRSTYAPYPYADSDGRNRAVFTTNEWLNLRKVVRGGSCLDREKRATASFRTAMFAWQRGYNVGFRVVADTTPSAAVPTAAFSASPTNGLVDLAVTFDGRASSDPGGPIWKFAWDFGDGSGAEGTNLLSHTYTVPGTYTATLTVTDGDSFTDSASRVITVRAPLSAGAAPIAQFTVSPATSSVPSHVTFDGRASNDPDGTITAYYWDFGDDHFGSGPTATHTFSRAGRFTASLSVVDNSGLRDTRTATVVVTGTNGNQAPIVDAGFSTVIGVSNTLTLRGAVSDDGLPNPPGAVTTTWSQVSGPGTVTFGDATATNTTARFSTNGTYVLQLTASDGGLTSSGTLTVTVSAQDPYRSPCEVSYSPDGTLLAVADRTAQSLVLINPATAQVTRTIPLAGEPRDLAWRDTNSLFVSENTSGTVAELNPLTGDTIRRLRAGPKPAGLAVVPGKQLLLVTDRGLNKLSIFDLATGNLRSEVTVVREPCYVAVTPDEKVAIVANHLPYGDARDPAHAAALSFVNLDTLTDVDHLQLPPGATTVQRVVCSPDGRWAYVLHVLGRSFLPTTQLSRGWVITSAMSLIDLQDRQLYSTILFDQDTDGAADPWGLTLANDGRTLWATFSGVHEIGKLDLAGLQAMLAANPALHTNMNYDLTTLYNSNLLQRVAVPGAGPRGLALAPNQSQLAVAAYFAGQVLLLDTNGQPTAQIALGAQPAEDSPRRGERLYFDANGCYQRWLSCNSCHPGTRPDGMNWDLMNDGFGNPKNTKSHLFATRTDPSMWSGIRANAMVGIQAGYKFIEFQAHPQQDYTDIWNFMDALTPEPSPYWVNGKLTPDAVQGKAFFESPQTHCLDCHKPDYYYADTNKYVVGTAHAADYTVNDLTGYVPPPLYELWRTAPYLHDGSAVTMRDVLTTFNVGDQHGVTSQLTPNQIDQLAAYLLQIGGDLPSGPTNPYSLNVVGGTGGGSYLPGSTVTIAAMVPSGSDFLGWLGEALQDPFAPVTTLIMPEQNLTVMASVSGAPTISPVANQVATVNTPTPPIAFRVSDDVTPASNLVVTATSSNPLLLPASGISLGGAGAYRSITLQPAPNQTGTATVTLFVNDGVLTTSESFALTVVRPVALALGRTAGALSLTWPADAGPFTLYTSAELSPDAVWTVVTNAPVFSNGVWTVVLPAAPTGERFYRLQTP